MAGSGQQAGRKYFPVPIGGVLDESKTPSGVGSGLTACTNLMYRRYGSWAKRSGSAAAYASSTQGTLPGTPVSGYRWARTSPTPLTQLVVAAQGALWVGGDPNVGTPTALTQLAQFTNVASTPLSFASVFDPQNGIGGSDILIICGATGPYGFATLDLILAGTPAAGQTVTATLEWTGAGATWTFHPDTSGSAPSTIFSAQDASALQLAQVPVGMASDVAVVATIPGNTPITATFGWMSISGRPGGTSWASGNYNVTLDLILGLHCIGVTLVEILQLDQTGTVIKATLGSQVVSWTSSGTQNALVAASGATPLATDRLAVRFTGEFLNPGGSGPHLGTLQYSAGAGTTSAVVTPLVNNNSVTSAPYTVLSTDNLETIAAALANAINLATPTLGLFGPATSDGAIVTVAAAQGGAAGNEYSAYGTVTSSGLTISPTSATMFTGGGVASSAPLKYDGNIVSGLSYQIQNPFTGCVTWHNHVWFWGDPSNPESLYASDIDQPEGFTFMEQNGPYLIGQGDGAGPIQACVPIGNILYVFKENAIYAITGYDFQSGEYEFNVQPAFIGYGIPAPGCISPIALNSALVFWDGTTFYRLSYGAQILENIGKTIPLTCGKIALGNPLLMQAISGTFNYQTLLNGAFFTAGGTATEALTNVALFACDTGDGIADTVLVYDDDATQFLGNYAWAPWKGWNVGGFISFGGEVDNVGNAQDQPSLFWIPPPGTGNITVNEFGANPTADSGVAISWMAQTGWITMETPALSKQLHRIFAHMEVNPGMTMNVSAVSAGLNNGSASTVYPPRLNIPFPVTNGPANIEAYQVLLAQVNPYLRGFAYMLQFNELSAATSYELTAALLDYIEEPFRS